MNLLRLLSGLAARAFGAAIIESSQPDPGWYRSTSLGEWCGSDTHCDACRTDGDCDLCDTIDGRHMDAVAEYAQTCDGCGELTENESLTMNRTTHLSYCRNYRKCRSAGAVLDIGLHSAYK